MVRSTSLLLGGLGVAAAITVALLVVRPIAQVYRNERGVLYPPVGPVPLPADAATLHLAPLDIPVAGGRIAAWFAPATTGGTVVLCTGTSATRANLLPEARALMASGHGVVLFDWPGHGESTGAVALGAPARDALRAVLRAVVRLPAVDSMRLGLFAMSFGGVTATPVVADDMRVRAMVLAGTPIDLIQQARTESAAHGWLGFQTIRWFWRLHGEDLESLALTDVAPRLAPRPVLVITGDRDRVVSPEHADMLVARIGPTAELWRIAGAEHAAYAAATSDYGPRLAAFFTKTLAPMPAAVAP